MKRKILVATTNPGKVAELKAMLNIDVELVGLADFEGIAEIVEDGATFAENARKKAMGYAKATGLWTVADDSGLVIDALDGAPGVKSARFSGEKDRERTLLDHRNMAKVLTLLEGIPAERRTARFVCALCLASPEKILIETEGTLEGLTQFTRERKNAISHRGNAIRKLKPLLNQLLANG
ncbi:MAG: non-canonical purine NTP pyrophosphatase [Planctomycetota bacterium]|jgi:XTP/dITP diphosphohydrolase